MVNEDRCAGCRHAEHSGEGFCYLFIERPETLPCGQHDKYTSGREAMGRMIRKNPLMLLWAMGEEADDE